MKKSRGKTGSVILSAVTGLLTALLCFAFLDLSIRHKTLGPTTVFHVSGELFCIIICQVISYSLSRATGRDRLQTIMESSRGFRIYRALCLVFLAVTAADAVVWMCFGYLAENTRFWMTAWYIVPMAGLALAYAGIFRWMSLRSKKLEDSFRHLMSENVVTEITKGNGSDMGSTAYLTVLFCQVRAPEASRGDAPENDADDSALHRFLRFFYSETAGICEKHGGTALEFPGYCVLCVFGAPEKLEKHESAAVDAAREIMTEMTSLKELREMTGFPGFDIAVGINTGNIHVGNVGSEDQKRFTVIGSSVNLASRLAGYAKPGEIIISENVRKAVNVTTVTEKTGTVMPKGFDEPVSIYRVKQGRGAG